MREQPANIGSRNIVIYHDDSRFIQEVLFQHEYKSILEDFVVVDLGANIGSFSFWIYDRARVIYAIEPSKRNIDCLNETIKQNGLDKIKTYCFGISGTGGQREFFTQSEPGQGGWQMDLNPSPSPLHELLPTKTVKEFFDEENIKHVDILKIDVEGAEKEIFASQGFKDVAERIYSIVGEYHQYDPTFDLESCGFEVMLIKDHSKFIARRI